MNPNNLEKANEIISKILRPDQFKDVSIQANGKKIVFNLLLDDPNDPKKSEYIKQIEEKLVEAGFGELDVYTTKKPENLSKGGAHRPIAGTTNRGHITPKSPIEGIKKIIAINSGKGGVGKTTCSVNLAIALSKLGYSVGLLDADITGPNVHMMLGIHEKPHINEESQKIQALEAHGIKAISMGTLTDPDKATIWRGPMLDGVIKQFLREVDWGELDYLFIDLPPGTSDAQLTICQNVALDGTIIISTPQDVALLDARKGFLMFQKMGVPILGIIENMSFFECPSCHTRTEIFDHGGGRKAAKELEIEFLGAIPIELKVRIGGDSGQPITVAEPDSMVAGAFLDIARNVSESALKA
jgi:ATP-binding protein involved in chromosome partitioning